MIEVKGIQCDCGRVAQPKTRRGSLRAEIGEAWVGKGPARHLRLHSFWQKVEESCLLLASPKTLWHTCGIVNLEILVLVL